MTVTIGVAAQGHRFHRARRATGTVKETPLPPEWFPKQGRVVAPDSCPSGKPER